MSSPTLKKVHNWLGLWLAAYFILQALAGGVLVFEHEIVQGLEAESTAQPSALSSRTQPPALAAIMATLEDQYPHWSVERINFPARAGGPYVARMNSHDGELRLLQLDPVTASVGPLSPALQTMQFIADFHINLLADKAGTYVGGVLGLLLVAMLVTGLIIAWPGLKGLRKALRVNFRVAIKAWFQLHRSTGLMLVLVILVTTLTGTVLAFSSLLRPLFVASEPMPVLAEGEPLPAVELLARAQDEFPGAIIRNLRFSPGNALSRAIFYGDRPGVAAPSHQVWLDPVRGTVRARTDGRDMPAGEMFFAWMYPLHTQFGLGRLGQMISLVGGLALMTLAVSGPMLWWSRRRLRAAKPRVVRNLSRQSRQETV